MNGLKNELVMIGRKPVRKKIRNYLVPIEDIYICCRSGNEYSLTNI